MFYLCNFQREYFEKFLDAYERKCLDEGEPVNPAKFFLDYLGIKEGVEDRDRRLFFARMFTISGLPREMENTAQSIELKLEGIEWERLMQKFKTPKIEVSDTDIF